MEATPEGAQVTVTRWRRFGHDRLSVRRPDGTEVGYWDLSTHRATSRDAADAGLVEHCARTWAGVPGPVAATRIRPAPDRGPGPESTVQTQPGRATPAPGGPTPDATGTPPVAPPSTDTRPGVAVSPLDGTWTDLVGQPAGAGARAQARALQEAAPVRTFLSRLFGLRAEERAWRIGADGEELVAAELAKLVECDPRWRVLHAVEVGERGADIDHVVIGPGGVFTLNTKHHPNARVWAGDNTFIVNGARCAYIGKSHFEARRASQLLSAACGFPCRSRRFSSWWGSAG